MREHDARLVAQLHPRLNSDLLITAALVHDLGKTEEFTYAAEIGLSDAGRLLGHVELGLRLLDARAGRVAGLDDERRLALAHCVLTHHGPDATGRAGSGRFGSPEALALYRLNALDASVKGALEHGLTDACKLGAKELVSMWGHPDQDEGPKAFAEKREPNWQ